MKLTNWFPATICPVRAGWFEIGCKRENGEIASLPFAFHYFDGKFWFDVQDRPAVTHNENDRHDLSYIGKQSCFWRGIAK